MDDGWTALGSGREIVVFENCDTIYCDYSIKRIDNHNILWYSTCVIVSLCDTLSGGTGASRSLV